MSTKSMSEKRRRLLDTNWSAWRQELRLEAILNELASNDGVLNDDTVDLINSEKTQHMRCFRFIKQLQTRGNEAFESFYYALIRTNQRKLAKLLEDEVDENKQKILANSNETNKICNQQNSEKNKTENNILETINGNNRIEQCNIRNDDEEFLVSKRVVVDPFREGSFECPSMSDIPMEVVEQNRRYYREYDDLQVKETRGILSDLFVESVDNGSSNGTAIINFDEKTTYRNFSSPRGMALIINNRKFENMPERLGTDVDECNFSRLLIQLGYSLTVYRNLCSKEMFYCVKDFARRPEHREVDSCVVCILTHGEHGEVYGVDDQCVSVLELVSQLNAINCPALAHKPKLFFLQACRGQRYDHGYPGGVDVVDGLFDRLFSSSSSSSSSSKTSHGSSNFTNIISRPIQPQSQQQQQQAKSPIEADILISYATTPGYVSWRNSLRGSWFVQSICEIFAKYAKNTDILSMLTMVSKQVAEAYESSSGACKQIPDHSSRLRRNFYFFPGLPRGGGISS